MGKHVETKYNKYFYHINSSLKGDMKEKCNFFEKVGVKVERTIIWQ